MVGVERDAEEVAVRADGPSGKVVRRAAVARHLAVHQRNVEVGKLDEVALRSFVATARHIIATHVGVVHNTGNSVLLFCLVVNMNS